MKSTIDLLNSKDRLLLAEFYNSETHRALKRMVDIERIELAKDALDLQDMNVIRHLSGQAYALKRLCEEIYSMYKSREQERDKKAKK